MNLNNKGLTLLEVTVAAGLLSIIILGQASMSRYTAAITAKGMKTQMDLADEKVSAQEVLDELKAESSNITRTCTLSDPNYTDCIEICNIPIACLHVHANNKTVQACEGDCTLSGGLWYKGTQPCDLGIECKR